jgi:hypothetical protein
MRSSGRGKSTSEVFGISNEVRPDSYVDRGHLDKLVGTALSRPIHVALKGESKCGKSWLRQRILPDALVVQCRLGKTASDIYRDALSALDIRLEVEQADSGGFSGRVEARGDFGLKLLARLGVTTSLQRSSDKTQTTKPVGRDISDLAFIADILKASGRRLVIEDVHYLSLAERRNLAFDLKTLWDYGVFVVISGVWSEQNMLLYLNHDLAGRVMEVPVVWIDRDMREIFARGGAALNLTFSDSVQNAAIGDCYENVGILQTLILSMLDQLGLTTEQSDPVIVDDLDALHTAAMDYAEQLNPLYQQFAQRVSRGIRKRKSDPTGIYPHAMAVILDASDEALTRGMSIDGIYENAHAREPRIQKGNLHTVLQKIEGLQVDDDGRGLVLAYNDANREVSVVDRQLLLYRKYSTVAWPWEDLIREARQQSEVARGT